ncbi:hypothetical protein AB0O47_39405 [Streptomyces noursei]|uniref:hypothetical protein n=1 Tax=Streptomyces noursei TaxID=1971 RepID=UPI00344EE0E2
MHDISGESWSARALHASAAELDEKDKPVRAEALRAGLEWLTEVQQPDDAICHHLGTVIHAQGNRWFGFQAATMTRSIQIDVNVRKKRIDVVTGVLENPLREGEMDEVIDELEALGANVFDQWNGDGTETGTLRLDMTPHPSLLAAVERYMVGCKTHPSRGSLCHCGWFGQGATRLVLPRLVAPAR